jgi:hypothetical protein
MAKFRILSIDGSGIRGLILAKVLSELEVQLQSINLIKNSTNISTSSVVRRQNDGKFPNLRANKKLLKYLNLSSLYVKFCVKIC